MPRYPILPPYDNSESTSRIIDLMLRQGESRAQDVAIRGDIWGSTIQNIGQGLGQAASSYFQGKAAEEEEQAFNAERDAVMTGLGQLRVELPPDEWAAEVYRALPADIADKYIKGIQGAEEAALSAQQLRQAIAAGDEKAAQAAREQAQDGFRRTYVLADAMGGPKNPTVARELSALLPIASEVAGMDLTLEQIQQPEVWKALGQGLMGPPETITATANQRVFERGPEGLTEVVGVVEEPVNPLDEREQLARIRKLEREASADPGKPAPSLNDVDKLAQRWTKATEASREIDRQVKIMEEGLKSARKGDLAAGSQAILVTFQKILDPTSVVRESEYARSAAGQSAFSRAEGIIDRLAKGGAGVPVSELEKFAELAKRMATAGASGYLGAEKERLGRLADQYNVDRDLVFPDYSFSEEESQTSANPFRQGGGSANPFRQGSQ